MNAKDGVKYLLFIGLGFLVYGAVKAKNYWDGLKINFSKIQVRGTIANPIVVLTIKIFNGSKTELKISNIEGKLFFQNKFIGNVFDSSSEVLRSNSNIFFDLQLQSSFTELTRLISDIVRSKKYDGFSFDGKININGVQMPYKGNLVW